MAINSEAVKELMLVLPRAEVNRAVRFAVEQQALEDKWVQNLSFIFDAITQKSIESLEKNGKISLGDLIEDFVMEHSVDVMGQAIRESSRDISRLAAPPKAKVPRSLRDLMNLWDQWKKKKKMPLRQRNIARRIKNAYLEKVQDVWRRYSEDFRKGDAATQDEVKAKLRKASEAAESRAKMIVETETTNYYTSAKREYYDEVDAVTHYLFVSIRDFRTSPWCYDGKKSGAKGRGRGGLVFTKGTQLLIRNTPACHPFCRSDLLPLVRFNPAHKKLIDNKSLRAENYTLHPLIPGWGRA